MKNANPLIYITPFFFIALVVLTWKFILHPQIASWVQSKIPAINSSQNYADIRFNKFHISLLKLQVSASDVEVKFKNDFKKFESLNVEQIKIQINPFELLIGQLSLTSITLEQLNWNFSDRALESHSKKAAEDLPLDILFKKLPEIPIHKVKLINSNIRFTSVVKKITFATHFDSVLLENLNSRLNLDILKAAQEVQYEANTPLRFRMDLSLSLTTNQLKINSFLLKDLESEVRIKGQLNQPKKVFTNPIGEFSIESTILSDDIRTMYLSLFPQKNRLPSVTGKIQTSGKFSLTGSHHMNGQVEINTTNLSVEHFKFGKAQIKVQIKNNQLSIEQINLEHPAGVAELRQIEIEQAKPYFFKTKLDVKSFNLQKLFISLGLNSIPADLNMTGNASCQGQLSPPFNVQCESEASVSNVIIKASSNEPLTILKVKQGGLKGKFLFNNEDARFDSQLTIGKSTGLVKGIVDFEKGFKIDFESNQLHVEDIDSIAGLHLSGNFKLSGTTWGGSDHGSLETEITADNAEIENFILGNFSSQLKYEKGNLFFRHIKGHLGQSDYLASLTFNFLNSSLSGNFNSVKLLGEDIFSALNKKFAFPFEFSGIGSADIEFSGPFNFWKLSYELKSSLKQGLIAGEGFERLDVNLSSNGEKIYFKDVGISKVKSHAALIGYIDTKSKQPEFDLSLKTNQAYIEEIDSIIKILPTLTGLIAVHGKITGALDSPEIKMDFNARQVNIDGFNYPPSQGEIVLDKKYFKLNGQLLGRQLQANLKWPWKEKDDYSVKLQIRDLNPLMLLPLISLPQPNREFYSRINLDIDLKSENKTISKSYGQINLSDFLLQRGTQILKLKAPSVISFENGFKKMDPIDLSGEDNKISIRSGDANKIDNKIIIQLAIKLRLFQFLVPFVESINGQLEAQAQVSLRSNSFQIFGDGQLSEGNLLLKGFPTVIEGIKTPIEFSQAKIFFNDISAHLGNSLLEGAGQIEIKGARKVIVQLQAKADNLELTFPEKITTAGKADLAFFGNWLPYTLKVNYKVSRGLVEKDFGQDNSETITVKASRFLPPKQIESQSPSLLLDVAVDLSQGIVIKNKLLEGSANGNLNIKGSPENPIILGNIDIKPGSKIIFKDKPFEVQTARIHFTPSNEINPEIYISALARVSDYDISLLVQGPAKSPSIEATSQPPLSKGDIFSLLALGMTSTKMDQNLSSEAQQRQTGIEVIAALSNQSEFNKKLQQTLGLNVQLAPSVDSTRNIAVPKVVVSKKILKKLNASYSKPLTGEQNQEVKLQYLFNPNWSGILNYQNKETNQQDGTNQIQNPNETGILGGEFEYKKEFKW